MKDEDLIIEILKGKTILFSEIIDRYERKVFSTAYGYSQNSEEAKDICQEIFIKLYNNLKKYKKQAKFSTWLYRIAVNHCIDWTRRNKKSKSVLFWTDGEKNNMFDYISDTSSNPEDILIKQEYIETIRECIDNLPEIYKTVSILYYMDDIGTKEISNILEIPRKTVETRLYRAKGMIKAILSKAINGGECCELQKA